MNFSRREFIRTAIFGTASMATPISFAGAISSSSLAGATAAVAITETCSGLSNLSTIVTAMNSIGGLQEASNTMCMLGGRLLDGPVNTARILVNNTSWMFGDNRDPAHLSTVLQLLKPEKRSALLAEAKHLFLGLSPADRESFLAEHVPVIITLRSDNITIGAMSFDRVKKDPALVSRFVQAWIESLERVDADLTASQALPSLLAQKNPDSGQAAQKVREWCNAIYNGDLEVLMNDITFQALQHLRRMRTGESPFDPRRQNEFLDTAEKAGFPKADLCGGSLEFEMQQRCGVALSEIDNFIANSKRFIWPEFIRVQVENLLSDLEKFPPDKCWISAWPDYYRQRFEQIQSQFQPAGYELFSLGHIGS